MRARQLGNVMPDTIIDLLQRRVRSTPDDHAFYVMTGGRGWVPVSWAAHNERIERLASALAAAEVTRGDRVAICAGTSLDWEVAQMAALRLGASVVGLDPNYPDDLLAKLLVELNVVVLVAQDGVTLERIPSNVRKRFRLILTVEQPGCDSPGIRSIAALCAVEASTSRVHPMPAPEDEAVVFFSSGTTGMPKPVFYRHGQLTLGVRALVEAFADLEEGSTLVCWLPLASVFQRMINFAAMARRATTYVVEDPRSVMDHIGVASPHTFIGVPRFFERVYAGITDHIEAGSGISRSMGRWAMALGQRRAQALRSGRQLEWHVRVFWPIADRLVLGRIRAKFGSNLRYFISGSAPMPYWLLEWFEGIGLPVLEGYAMSENIVPIASNRYHARKLGTVGKPLPEHEVMLAEDGEILVRGAGVASDKSGSSAAAITSGTEDRRFLATGDLGEFDADGFLRITGRKADVFKTSSGRWVAPAGIEGRLRRLPYVELAVIFGVGRGSVVALLGVTETYFDALISSEDQALANGEAIERSDSAFKRQLCQDAGATTADLPAFQRPAGLLVMPVRALTIAGGDLTTNLKVRRHHIEAKYAITLDRLWTAIDRSPSPRSGGNCLVMIVRSDPRRG